ncbi:MAG: hypothetical protein ABIO44_14160 [Saprospiraceae bacterium]
MKKIIILFTHFFVIITFCTSQIYFNKVIPSSQYYVEGILCQATFTQSNEVVSFVNSYFRDKYGWLNKICRLDEEGEVIDFKEFLDSLNPEFILV